MAEAYVPPDAVRDADGQPVMVATGEGPAILVERGTLDYERARRYRITPRACRGCGTEWGPATWDDPQAFHAYQVTSSLPMPAMGWDVVAWICGRCGEPTCMSGRAIEDAMRRQMRRPGRPEVGQRIPVRLGPELLAAVDVWRDTAGMGGDRDRAAAIRELIRRGLAAEHGGGSA